MMLSVYRRGAEDCTCGWKNVAVAHFRGGSWGLCRRQTTGWLLRQQRLYHRLRWGSSFRGLYRFLSICNQLP